VPMSTWRYFVTEDELDAKTGQMVRKAKELRERLTKLDDELKEFARSWNDLSKTSSGINSRAFRIGDKELTVINTSRSMETIATVPWKHFDAEAIKRLLRDIQQTSEELSEAESGLRALGI